MIHRMRSDAYYQDRARDLRRNMTSGETLLWSRLRAHRMDGRKFRRQHAIGSYIVDFVCLQSRLVIEVDGDSHADDLREALDAQRTAYLEKVGFRVLRFGNHSVVTNLDGVAEAIYWEVAQASAPLPNPLPEGEREAMAPGSP